LVILEKRTSKVIMEQRRQGLTGFVWIGGMRWNGMEWCQIPLFGFVKK